MGQYSGQEIFHEKIYTFEETDVVLGGENGIDNLPLKQLADRTAFLQNKINTLTGYTGSHLYTSNRTLTTDHAGKLITLYADGILTIILEDVNKYEPGTTITFKSYCIATSVIRIQTKQGQFFYDPWEDYDTVFMHQREHITLVATLDKWIITNESYSFYAAGEETKSRKILPNTVPAMGQLLSRTYYPRLWRFVQSLTMYQQVTTEEIWFSDPLNYRGLYTTGDNATTFRIPDERATFERMLDLGRGISTNRPHNYAGGYEPDNFKSHSHSTEEVARTGYPREAGERTQGYYWMNGGRDQPSARIITIGTTGGSETNSKNIAKLFLIRY